MTLNYDLLLDKAIERVTKSKFTGFGSYTSESDKWVLIKPHGSVNWFRQIVNFSQTGNNHDSWKATVEDINLLKDLGKDIVFLDLEKQFKDGYAGSIPYYPVLAIPNTEYNPIYPINENLLLKERLQECENFLIIGFSAHDQDILNLLKDNVKSVKKLLIVGMDDVGDVYKRLTEIAPVFLSEIPERVLYGLGFGRFMREGVDINNFLNDLYKSRAKNSGGSPTTERV